MKYCFIVYVLFLEANFLRFLSIQLPQPFFAEADTKEDKYALAKASNAVPVKLTD